MAYRLKPGLYLNPSSRPLLDNGYDKSGACIVAWVTTHT
jgi:hypothetical protein